MSNKTIVLILLTASLIMSYINSLFQLPSCLLVTILFFIIYAEELEKRKLSASEKEVMDKRIKELEQKFNNSAIAAMLRPINGGK